MRTAKIIMQVRNAKRFNCEVVIKQKALGKLQKMQNRFIEKEHNGFMISTDLTKYPFRLLYFVRKKDQRFTSVLTKGLV